ncbi:MAG: AAA family ATPase [Actinomycetota bacterium]|nr:AAA family ATPase [Actinomycetota bacterium]
MDVQFRILGPIEVDLEGGRPARVPRGRALSLLALLLLRHGGAVHLDRVVDELWEGAGPQHARNAVQLVASRLRAALGEDLVVFEGGGYALRLLPGALDADRFEERMWLGREELARGEPGEAAATLRHALELWRGPALADVADERFAQPEIARLDDLRLGCLSERIEADLTCGRHAEVAGELEALVREHPLRERLRGQQMLALYRAGRQADALAAYRSAYSALVDGLGIEPSPELRALEAAILRQDVPAPEPPPPSAQRTPVAVDARRLVTCVFSQLTQRDERVGLDAESLRAVLERYHDMARPICAGHGGIVAELRSDAVLAVFGTPVAHEDDPQRALRAAAELVARTEQLPFGLRARCGVCTGEVVAPAQGPAAAPLIGEAVGSAERLARSGLGGEIRMDGSTWRLVRHGAQAFERPDGGFLLVDIDADAPAIGRRLDRRLIGREEEVGRLRATFARVVGTRTPELMTIVGEPGIGKSHLAAQLTTIAGDGGRLLTGRCPAYGERTTYWPLREIVLQAMGVRSIDELAATLGIAPSVGRQVAAAVGFEESRAGEDAGWAFLRLIDALARVQPLIVVIDDAHLAEPALLDLLLDVPARLHDAPALFVWVARPDLFERRPDWASRIGAQGVLKLGRLSAAASSTLLDAIAGDRLDQDEERRIAEAGGGNPLFLEQLVAYVDEQHPSADRLPPALHALLAARLDRLDAAERSALALGAVAGDVFEIRSVHALAGGITRAELEQACDRLIRRDLLVRSEAGVDAGSFRFRHGLVREAAYASLAKAARARLHERHAAWLEGLGSDLPEADARIGFHLETACRYEQEIGAGASADLSARAGRRLEAAARVARGRGDLLGEIGFLDRAVALLGTEHEQGAALLPALVSALFEAGSSGRAEELADRAVSTSASLGLAGVGARSAIERQRIRLSRHPESFEVAAAVAVVEQASETLRELGDELGLARAAYLMSDLAWLMGDPVASYADAERMLTHARRAGSGFDVATALIFMAWALVEGPWPTPVAIARCDALTAEAAGQRAADLTLLGCRAVLMAMTGHYDQAARNSLAEARAGLGEQQLHEIAAYLALLDAVAETLAGDPTAAERAVLDAEAIVSESGDRWYLSLIYVDLAHAILAQHRVADAAEAVARIETLPAPCDAEWVIKRHTARALLAAQAGEHERGLEDARAAVDAAEKTGLIVCCANAHRTLAELLWATGRTHAAAAAARRALVLDEAKANAAAAAATRQRFPRLLASM